jgi:hypothetical protein
VPLTPCTDLTPADWISGSDLPWHRLVTFGPSGFPVYARLRFLPDPTVDGQHEHEAVGSGRSEDEQLRLLLDVLAAHTSTPEECYFCVWDGYGDLGGPKVTVPHRSYHLFAGPLRDARAASTPTGPAFVWPADHAWCVARDVDPHWAGIGATRAAVDQLVADPRLDVVVADPGREQPAYR